MFVSGSQILSKCVDVYTCMNVSCTLTCLKDFIFHLIASVMCVIATRKIFPVLRKENNTSVSVRFTGTVAEFGKKNVWFTAPGPQFDPKLGLLFVCGFVCSYPMAMWDTF